MPVLVDRDPPEDMLKAFRQGVAIVLGLGALALLAYLTFSATQRWIDSVTQVSAPGSALIAPEGRAKDAALFVEPGETITFHASKRVPGIVKAGPSMMSAWEIYPFGEVVESGPGGWVTIKAPTEKGVIATLAYRVPEDPLRYEADGRLARAYTFYLLIATKGDKAVDSLKALPRDKPLGTGAFRLALEPVPK